MGWEEIELWTISHKGNILLVYKKKKKKEGEKHGCYVNTQKQHTSFITFCKKTKNRESHCAYKNEFFFFFFRKENWLWVITSKKFGVAKNALQ